MAPNIVNPTLNGAMRHINELLQAGMFRDAHARLLDLVSANPRFVEGLRLLAATHQVLGDSDAAEALLRRALALQPDWPPTLATLGELLLARGRAGDAEPLLRRAAGGRTPLPRAAFVLARYLNDAGRAGEALAVAAPLCLAGRADAELATQHIAALAALGRTGEAVACYARLAIAHPDNPAIAHSLAIALTVNQQTAEAERIATQTLGRGYRSAALLNLHARNLIARGATDAAETTLREALRVEPRLVDAHHNLARLVWMRSGDIHASIATLDEALRRFEDDDALRAAKAELLQGSGDARGAFACLAERASRAQAPPMLILRAGLAALEFDPATARPLAERAQQAMPGHLPARSLLAAACLGSGDPQRALELVEALLFESPDDQYLIALQTTAWRILGDERYAHYCDYAHLVVPQRLDTPPGWQDLAGFLSDLNTSLNRLHDPHGPPLLFQSLRHGTETTGDLAGSRDPVIRALFAAFAAPVERYLAHIGHGPDPLRRRNQGRWRFNGAWSVRLRSQGYHANHVHPRGWVSSACYLALPSSMAGNGEEGVLRFGEPSLMTVPPLVPAYSVRPEVGMLVLFPSYAWHGTVPFHGDQPRLTVAFDVVPQG